MSYPDSTHKTIEEAVEFINSKIKKHNDMIQHHTEKLKYYRQIKDTLDGEVRWRSNNRARISGSSTTSSSKKTSSNTRKRPSRVVPLLQPVNEEIEEDVRSLVILSQLYDTTVSLCHLVGLQFTFIFNFVLQKIKSMMASNNFTSFILCLLLEIMKIIKCTLINDSYS